MIRHVFSGSVAAGMVLVLAACAQETLPASLPGEQEVSAPAAATPTATPADAQAPVTPAATSLPTPVAPPPAVDPSTATLPSPRQTPSPIATPKGTPRPVGGQVGNQAPSFTLTLADGKTATLSSLVTPGKLLLIEFFTTW